MIHYRADGVRDAHPLFQAEGDRSPLISALQLRLVEVHFDTARELNSLWHSRLPKYLEPACGQLCWAAEYDGRYYAVAIWTHPVARALPQKTWLELRRLAIAPDRPQNAASRTLAVMAKMVKKERPEIVNLISYQDLGVHSGTIYKAAGWTPTTVKRFSSWTNNKRTRPKEQSQSDKQRWERAI